MLFHTKIHKQTRESGSRIRAMVINFAGAQASSFFCSFSSSLYPPVCSCHWFVAVVDCSQKCCCRPLLFLHHPVARSVCLDSVLGGTALGLVELISTWQLANNSPSEITRRELCSCLRRSIWAGILVLILSHQQDPLTRTFLTAPCRSSCFPTCIR